MGNCKDCKFWSVDFEGRCSYSNDYDDPSEVFYPDADALDDSGLWCWIVTGPMFGCKKFKEVVNA